MLEYVQWSREYLQNEYLCDSDKNYLQGVVLCDIVNKQWGNPRRGKVNQYWWQEEVIDQENRVERWEHTIIEELCQPYIGEQMEYLFGSDE